MFLSGMFDSPFLPFDEIRLFTGTGEDVPISSPFRDTRLPTTERYF
jgi:hypothetical protein